MGKVFPRMGKAFLRMRACTQGVSNFVGFGRLISFRSSGAGQHQGTEHHRIGDLFVNGFARFGAGLCRSVDIWPDLTSLKGKRIAVGRRQRQSNRRRKAFWT
jgi:hypothetical protein